MMAIENFLFYDYSKYLCIYKYKLTYIDSMKFIIDMLLIELNGYSLIWKFI